MSKYFGRIITDLAPTGYSVSFDGNGDRIQTASNAALALGSNDFSIEWWEFRTVVGSEDTPVLTGDYSSGFVSCLLGYSGNVGGISTNGASWNVFNFPAYVDPLLPGVWNHFVYTRSGTAFRVFMNGKLSNYATGSGSVVQNNNRFNLGGTSFQPQFDFPGYISNFRVVIGAIPTLYQTSSTTAGTRIFTPPTQLFPTANMVLLTCNSTEIVDQSSNNILLTPAGSASVSTFTPFAAYEPYNPSLGAATPGVWTVDEAMQAAATRRWNMYDPSFNQTTLLLHGNGTNGAQNNTFLDSSTNNFSMTRNGNATQGTFSPFSQGGWSYLGLANSDRITTSSVDPGNFGSGAFTIEAWVYFNDTGASGQRVIASNYQNSTTGWWFYRNNVGGGAMQFHGSGDGADITGTTTMIPGRWYHVAVSGTPTSPGIRLFVNGVQEGVTFTGAVSLNSTNAVVIGDGAGGAAGYGINGYISNFRILKGTALYTTNFTPPTSPLTRIANTALLTCQSNRFVDNSGNGYTFTTSGSPSIQPFSPFYSTIAYSPQTVGGGGYFDGSGDYLTAANNAAFNFGSGDFCVETWFYSTLGGQTQRGLITLGVISSGAGAWLLWLNASGFPAFYVTTNGTSGTATNLADTRVPPANTWTHIAVARTGNTLSLFVNGSRVATTAYSSTVFNDTTNLLHIAASNGTSVAAGYLSGSRIIKGSSPYDATLTTLTLPTAPVTAITNTSLLLNYTNAGIIDSTGDNSFETVGNASISTAQSRFGNSSIFFDGTGDYLLARTTEQLYFRTSDWTVECWVYFTSITPGNFQVVFATGNQSTGQLTLRLNNSAKMTCFADGGLPMFLTSLTTFVTNTWYHVAVARQQTTVRMLINGIVEYIEQNNTYSFTGTGGITVGIDVANGYPMFGYVEDLRITKGVARYTGNTVVQSSQWQDQ